MQILDLHCEDWPKWKRFCAVEIKDHPNGRSAIRAAIKDFETAFGGRPLYAFVRGLPKGAENGVDVDGTLLFDAEWCPIGKVLVGGLCNR